MKIKLLCIGTRMPAWVEAAVKEYQKRIPQKFKVEIVEIPLGIQGGKVTVQAAHLAKKKEGQALLKSLDPRSHVVALEVTGKSLSTLQLAQRLGQLHDESTDLNLLVGGPDGLAEECLAVASEHWSLSALTFPHPIVRVILAEQIYRAWSILSGHPYHRE
jgi:23S rRNA (pseudouridine1915-N3)-methyltransferase